MSENLKDLNSNKPIRTQEYLSKLYTPNMIFAATLIGGTVGGLTLFRENYQILGENEKSGATLLIGLIGIFLVNYLFCLSPISLWQIVVLAMVIGYPIIFRILATKIQWQRIDRNYSKQSWGKTIGIAIFMLPLSITLLLIPAIIQHFIKVFIHSILLR
jgi:hypothetical protein